MGELQGIVSAEVQAYNDVCKLAVAKLDRRAFDERRQGYIELFKAFPLTPAINMEIADAPIRRNNHAIPLRVFKRRNGRSDEPCLIYAHGGGFISGNIDICNSIATELARDLAITVVTFHYRLSPENPFPAPLEDCGTVVESVAQQAERFGIDPARILFGGESCGGNFAAAVALLLRDRNGHRLAGQVAINPVFDVHRWADRAVQEGTEEFQDEMFYFTSNYLGPNRDSLRHYASPLLATDLSGLPPAFIWAAGLDPLHREALAFGDRLRMAGVPARVRVKPGVVHGCIRARHYYQFASEVYREVLEGIDELITRAA
jgi:acetyl esterase/lipase